VKKERRYDTKRTPSWCDRILYYSKDKLKLTVFKYTAIDVFLSDHKPVCGGFRFLCKK
jgi:glycerol-3-phosphate cytidylyltransferase-like family protein